MFEVRADLYSGLESDVDAQGNVLVLLVALLLLTSSNCKILESYDWPGNVRELENVIESVLQSSRSLREAGAKLGINASTVSRKIRQYGIDYPHAR